VATGPAKRVGRERGEEGERKKGRKEKKMEKNGERERERGKEERGERFVPDPRRAVGHAQRRSRVRGPGGDGARAALAAKRRPGACGREWKREREIRGDDRDGR